MKGLHHFVNEALRNQCSVNRKHLLNGVQSLGTASSDYFFLFTFITLITFIYVAVCGTVTVPLCPFKLPGQLFPPLVPVVRPDKEDSSVMRGWGRGCGGHGSGWNPWGHRTPSQTSHNTLQRSATGAFMSQSETYSRIAFITTSYSHIHKYFNLSPSHL